MLEPVIESEEYKMRFSDAEGSDVKVEVNTINREVSGKPIILNLCPKAQELFEMYCEIQVVPFGQLYGGKIVAALDRQHPRDLFDIRNLLDESAYNDELKTGVIFCMLSSKRPFQELLNPSRFDHRRVLEAQFGGMTDQIFTYEIFEATRNELIDTVRKSMTDQDRSFLRSFFLGEPSWFPYDFGKFPGVQWKLLNINMLKKLNPAKHKLQLNVLDDVLASL